MNIKRITLYIVIICIFIASLIVYLRGSGTIAIDWLPTPAKLKTYNYILGFFITILTLAFTIIGLLLNHKGIKNQEKYSKQPALSELLKEYNDRIKTLEIRISEAEKQRIANWTYLDFIRELQQNSQPYKNPRLDELKEIKEKRSKILAEFEKLSLDK